MTNENKEILSGRVDSDETVAMDVHVRKEKEFLHWTQGLLLELSSSPCRGRGGALFPGASVETTQIASPSSLQARKSCADRMSDPPNHGGTLSQVGWAAVAIRAVVLEK
jgi:hypothetical protein